MTTDELLKAICGRDSRPIFQNPWTIVVDGFTCSAATDGMRALFIADPKSPYPAEPHPFAFTTLLRTDMACLNAPELSRAELLTIVGGGEPVDWGTPCHDCCGQGLRTCNLGEEHHCGACGGSGSASGANSYSSRRPAPLSIAIGDQSITIDMQLLRGVIANLPGDPIRVVISLRDKCFFYGDGWELVVAALSHEPNARIPSIEARRSPLGGPHGER